MSDTFSPDDVKFMQLALELAAKGQYTTTPNPSVGCVLVKNGEIVGKGHNATLLLNFPVKLSGKGFILKRVSLMQREWRWPMPVRKRKAQLLM